MKLVALMLVLVLVPACLAVEPGVDYARVGQVQYTLHEVCSPGAPCAQRISQRTVMRTAPARRGIFRLRRGCGG